MVVQFVLAFQLVAAPIDRTRAAEAAEMALKEQIRANQGEAATREEMRRRHFEVRFNTLVDAVSQFAKEYNAGHGGIWPQRQADILRKAMFELQSLEATLARGGERSPACATDFKR